MNDTSIVGSRGRSGKAAMMSIVVCVVALLAFGCHRNTSVANEGSGAAGADSTILSYPIQGMSFRGTELAWLVTSDGKLMHSRDRGETWATMPGVGENYLKQVSFLDATNGFAADAGNRILRTTDAGTSWKATSKIPTLISRIHFLDELHGWAIDPFAVWRTNDAATTWQRTYPSTHPLAVPKTVYPVDETTVWAGCANGLVSVSKNGGIDWKQQKIAEGDIKDLFFVTREIGWLAISPSFERNAPTIYCTRDGGNTWVPQATREGFTALSVQFLTANEGWAVGTEMQETAEGANTRGVIIHTSDGGANWRMVYRSDEGTGFVRAHFTDRSFGWIAGVDKVYRTTDGGQTLKVSLDLSSLWQTAREQGRNPK